MNKFDMAKDLKLDNISEKQQNFEEYNDNNMHQFPLKDNHISLTHMRKQSLPVIKTNLLNDLSKQINDYGYDLLMKNTADVAQKPNNDNLDQVPPSQMPTYYTPHGYFDIILTKSNKSKAKIRPFRAHLESKKSFSEVKPAKNNKLEPIQQKSKFFESHNNFKLPSMTVSDPTETNRDRDFICTVQSKLRLPSRKFSLSNEIVNNLAAKNLASIGQPSTKESMHIFNKKMDIQKIFSPKNKEFDERNHIKNINKVQLQFPIKSID